MVLGVDDRERVRTLTFQRPEAANAFSEELYLCLLYTSDAADE